MEYIPQSFKSSLSRTWHLKFFNLVSDVILSKLERRRRSGCLALILLYKFRDTCPNLEIYLNIISRNLAFRVYPSNIAASLGKSPAQTDLHNINSHHDIPV
jgi:hypothetical protein